MARGQRKKIQNGQTGYKRFEDESGAGGSISRGRQIVQWRYVCRRSSRRKSQCYEWGYGRGKAPRVRATKSSEFGEGKL